MGDKREREEKVSRAQKEALLQFMEDHEDFARGKLLGMEGRKTWKALWDSLTTILNNIEGPNKTNNKWQRVWTDIKNKIKKKAADLNRSRSGTGGGPPSDIYLNNFEERCLNILTEEAVFGIQGPDGVPLASDEPQPGSSQQEQNYIPPPPRAAGQPMPEDESLDSVQSSVQSTPPTSSAEVSDAENSTPTRPAKRAKKQDNLYASFLKQNEEMNKEMKKISGHLETLAEEKRSTNALLYVIAESLKKLCGDK